MLTALEPIGDPMKRRHFPATGLEVSELGLGCMSFSGYYGASGVVDAASARRVVDRALELGINFFDTAAMYGPSETLLGGAIAGRRSRAVVATKFGIVVDEHGRPKGSDARPEAVFRSCDESLSRLGIDAIDLYYLHRIDRAVPIEETVDAMAELVRRGKVRFLGLCEVSATTLRRAQRVHPIAVLQSEYSLWTRDIEAEVLPTCRELGIGMVPYSPLGRGFLTGKIASAQALQEGDARRAIPRFQGENFERNRALLSTIVRLAAAHEASPAQVALAWLLSRGEDIVPIPGTKDVSRLGENAGATQLQLSRDCLAELDREFLGDRVS
ncbi:MAG TPA: aldo/keto reductase, partial [Stellaceae bacterium]|nr:aldo/keto reductase [Stellaceae bacterium]